MSAAAGMGRDVATVRLPAMVVVGNRRSAAQRIRDAVTPATRRVVLDFSDVGYVDSSGLGTLVTLARELRPRGVAVVAAVLNDDLRELFTLTKLDLLIPFFAGVEEAVRAELRVLRVLDDDDGGGGSAA